MIKRYYEVEWSYTVTDIPVEEAHDKKNYGFNKNILMYYSFEKFRNWFGLSTPEISISRLKPNYYFVEFNDENNEIKRTKI